MWWGVEACRGMRVILGFFFHKYNDVAETQCMAWRELIHYKHIHLCTYEWRLANWMTQELISNGSKFVIKCNQGIHFGEFDIFPKMSNYFLKKRIFHMNTGSIIMHELQKNYHKNQDSSLKIYFCYHYFLLPNVLLCVGLTLLHECVKWKLFLFPLV